MTNESFRGMKDRLAGKGLTGVDAAKIMAKSFESPLKAEQFAAVMANNRTCRGPLVVTDKAQAAGFKAWYALEATGYWGGAVKLLAKLVTNAQLVADKLHGAPGKFRVTCADVEEGNWDGLRRVIFPFIRLFAEKVGKPCSVDLNEEVVRHPWDGAEHVTDCPGCGAPHSWRAATPA